MKKYFLLIKEKTGKYSGKFFAFYKKFQNQMIQPETDDINQQLILKLNKKKIPNLLQIKQLPKFLNKIEKLQLIVALLILIISSTALGWRFYLKNSITVPKDGGSYTEGLIGAPRLVNPILADTDVDRDLIKLVFSGLMKFDQQGQLIPDLANGYTIDAEQTTYTFELKNNIRWHNGEPITANDVVFTINSIKNVEYNSPFKNSFNGITINQINDHTIQFKLEKPFAPFLSILTIGIIPEHLWYSIPAFGASRADLNIKPIGSGPYKFKSLTRESNGNIKNYTLETYNDYHLDAPHIEELHFKFYPDFLTGATALQNKNIDGLIYLPKEYKEDIKSNKKVNFYNLQFPQYTAVFFNPKNNDLLSDKNIRRALAISVNKEKILTEVLNDDGQIIHAPILPGLIGYDPETKAEDYSPNKAAEILDNLKWTKPEEGQFRTKTNNDDEEEELSIKLTTINQSENVKAATIIQESWEAIGIQTELEIISKNKIKKDVIETRNYQALVFGEVINVNSGPYPFWHSSQNQHPGLNLSVLANKDIDSYLEDVRNAKTDQTKLEPLQKFQEKLLALNFAIFLYNPTYTYPVNNKIKGPEDLRFINLPADRFNNITAWYIKTKRVISREDS
ncbi:ABC transporter substrate-binding protein [bacterium]|nr:ABC transporter substrate-binding protein [bacterium]